MNLMSCQKCGSVTAMIAVEIDNEMSNRLSLVFQCTNLICESKQGFVMLVVGPIIPIMEEETSDAPIQP